MQELEALERADALHVKDVRAAQPCDALRTSTMQVTQANGAVLPPAARTPSASQDRWRHVHASMWPNPTRIARHLFCRQWKCPVAPRVDEGRRIEHTSRTTSPRSSARPITSSQSTSPSHRGGSGRGCCAASRASGGLAGGDKIGPSGCHGSHSCAFPAPALARSSSPQATPPGPASSRSSWRRRRSISAKSASASARVASISSNRSMDLCSSLPANHCRRSSGSLGGMLSNTRVNLRRRALDVGQAARHCRHERRTDQPAAKHHTHHLRVKYPRTAACILTAQLRRCACRPS